jgi:hypothetical protein
MLSEKCLDALPVDKGYGYRRCHVYLKRRGINSRAARKGIEMQQDGL